MEKQYTPKKAKSAQLTNEAVAPKKVPEKVISSAQVTSEKTEIKPETETKAETKTIKKEAIKVKKEEAVARGLDIHASKKHCMYICSYIKFKSIDKALADLQDVIKMKKPIPFKGEIPHRHNPGMMSGRYPVNASKQFIYILKALKGNALVNGLELDRTRIASASANWASRPQKRGGARFKRVHVLLTAREVKENKNQTGDKK